MESLIFDEAREPTLLQSQSEVGFESDLEIEQPVSTCAWQRPARKLTLRRAAMATLAGVAAVSACLIAWASTSSFSRANLDSVARANEEQTVEGYCGGVLDDTEYHTVESLYWVSNIVSKELCCAECNAHPECDAWTYGKKDAGHEQGQHCYLKKLADGESPHKISREGFVSGVIDHKVRKHGIMAELLSKGLHEDIGEEPDIKDNETCPGKLNMTGFGSVAIIAAMWRQPDTRAARVEVPERNWAVIPHLNARAYFGKKCSVAETNMYRRSEYVDLQLLGSVMRYTADVSKVGCGCNAQLHLVPMSRNKEPSKCKDFFCGHGWQRCGVSCAEVGVQDANKYAWSTNLHVHDDNQGPNSGYGGGLGWIGRRDWNASQYGPGGECIDTTWPFDVAIAFPVNSNGELQAVEVLLSQVGKRCVLEVRLDEYSFKGRDGIAELSRVLEAGVTPVISYWNSDSLAWMDGAGVDGKGPCVKDAPEACPATVRFYNFALESWRGAQAPAAQPEAGKTTMHVAIDAVHEHVRLSLDAWEQEQAHKLVEGRERTDVPNVTVFGGDFFPEQHPDNYEWEVMLSSVYVRNATSYSAGILGRKLKGEVVHGKRNGIWIKLVSEPGYMAVEASDGTQLLRLRLVDYKKIVTSTCSNASMFAIVDEFTCLSAGMALGYFDKELSINQYDEDKSPEGCYLRDGQLYLSKSMSNVGNGVVGDMMPICASQAYPTTTTTTSTESTTTTTTSTKTASTTTTSSSTTSSTGTSTSSTTWGSPSFFCVEVVRVKGYELPLVKNQQLKGASIFSCEEYIVFSDGGKPELVGIAPNGDEIMTVVIPPIKEAVGNMNAGATTNSWLNTKTFLQVWDLCNDDGRYKNHDWTVKVDPDAVFFPDRLRNHMKRHTQNGAKLFVMNCARFNPVALYGSVEIFSKGALDTYLAGQERCRNGLPWHGWGEDYFMSHCMDMLQVGRVYDFDLLSDKRCFYHPCWDRSRVVFHDYKDASLDGSWFKCWNQSKR